jgi:hypothetical protein
VTLPHSMRFRAVVLIAIAGAALLLFIPVSGLAQTKPDKQAIVERETQAIAAARATPQPPKNVAKPARIQRQPLPQAQRPDQASSSPLPHRSAGNGTIVESGQAPFPAAMYTFENRWFERSGGAELVVYAGAAHDDPAQGVLAVRLVGTTMAPATIYRTPARSGSVRVVGADGERLQLLTPSGARFIFDVSSRSFVSH